MADKRRDPNNGMWTGPDGQHRLSSIPEYRVWVVMIQRCHSPKDKNYPRYGARGITVCEEWRKSFVSFIADIGRRPSKKHTIDRIDNEKGYFPANCRWATRAEQSRNQRTNRWFELDGRRMTLSDWAKEYGLYFQIVDGRMRRGAALLDALTKPKAKRRGGIKKAA